ncbi:MAG: nitroreductase family deazaflavin-dependent oxidoreductase [Gammaproteobacteria bacterium]|nr:MAG: nitroreductase family deazaflavin-dependent oxidoreductase [Gammaproteobacteria bacterium]
MPAASRNALTEFIFRVHPWLYRRTGGRLGGKVGRFPFLLLNTRGRKSGEPRTNGLMYLKHGDAWAIAASWAGEPKHPAWYHNLMADPDTTIEVDGSVVPVRARKLEGEERASVWQKIVEHDSGFATYEERTRGVREIPVILLERRPARLLYGLSCSYFTGKLEAYFQSKGIPFHFVEMNRGYFKACAQATGVAQLPCTQEPDGTWLTDSTKIIEHFEAQEEGLPLTPNDPATAFCSLLLEDLFDEWFWRPALYYRWAHDDDARLMSTELAREILRDVPLPLFVRRWFILLRQRIVYLRKDGVTRQTAPLIEQLYLDSLSALDTVFAKRPFLFGERPCEADFGAFGPFFRHFFCDPTSGALMRKRAPHLTNWVTRLWKARPEDLQATMPVAGIPQDLGFFFDMVPDEYLPYLEANAAAAVTGAKTVSDESRGVQWQVPTAPYRVECLNQLRLRFQKLSREEQARVGGVLSDPASSALRAPEAEITRESRLVGRLGRPLAAFD